MKKHREIRDSEGHLIRRVPDYAAMHSTNVADYDKINWHAPDKRDMRYPESMGRQIMELVALPDYPQRTACEAADTLFFIR